MIHTTLIFFAAQYVFLLELVTKRVLEILVFFVCKGGRKLKISFFLTLKELIKLMNTTTFFHEQERSQLNAI